MYTTKQYVIALRVCQNQMTDAQKQMLRVQYAAPDRTVTSQELAAAIGWRSHSPVNLWYGDLGKIVGQELGYSPKAHRFWFEVLSEEIKFPTRIQWRMHPALAEALRTLGMV